MTSRSDGTHWRARFSLVTLLTLFVPLSIVAAWLGNVRKNALAQKHVVDRILRHGGDVRYSMAQPERNSIDYPERLWRAPAWLAPVGGDDLLNSVKSVSLVASENGNRNTIKLLPMLKELRQVGIYNIRLGEEQYHALAQVRALTSLTVGRLDVAGSTSHSMPPFPISDSAVAALCGLRQLELLCLSDVQLTDAHVALLVSLRQIRTASFARTQVTDVGMRSLAELPKLAHLDLSCCRVGDFGVNELLRSVALESLWLPCTNISDVAIETIAHKNCCTVLDIGGCRITDTAVRSLCRATKLRMLILDETAITERYIYDLINNLRSLHYLSIRGTRIRMSFAAHMRLHDPFGSVIYRYGARVHSQRAPAGALPLREEAGQMD